MDWIALASIVTSGFVAVSTVLVSLVTARDQRKHEAALAYEVRSGDRKTEALLTVIRASVLLLEQTRKSFPTLDLVTLATHTMKDFDEALPGIEAYASQGTRTALMAVREQLQPAWTFEVQSTIAAAEAYTPEISDMLDADVGNLEQAMPLIEKHRELLTRLSPIADELDLAALTESLTSLVAEARRSLRGEL